jgi:hypothetical protein
MTKEQADAKLALLVSAGALPSGSVTTYYEMISDAPYLAFEYTLSNNGIGTISIPINPLDTNLSNLVDNLPIAQQNRLAALAIMLAPSVI